MLTKTDLNQIRKVVRDEVESESNSLKEDLQGEIKLSRIKIEIQLQSLGGKVKNLERDIKKVNVNIGKIEKNIAKIRKDLKTIVGYFDKEILNLDQRLDKVEEHLKLATV